MSDFLNWCLENCAARFMRVIEFVDEVTVAPSTEGGAASTLEVLDVLGDDWHRHNLGDPS
jgi:hypothetical protein